MIVHVVLMKLRPGVGEAELSALMAEIAALREGIPGYLGITWGHEAGFEPLARGYDFGFAVRFRSEADIRLYHVHPRHVAAGERLVALCEGGIDGVLVFDHIWPEA
jgi:hypothetical protein